MSRPWELGAGRASRRRGLRRDRRRRRDRLTARSSLFVQSNPGAAIASWNLNTHMMITAASSLQIIIIATLILVGAAHLPPVRHEKPAGHDRAAARRGLAPSR